MTNKDYSNLADRESAKSKSYINIPAAFVSGGLICVIGQAFMNGYLALGVEKDVASSAASCTLVFLSALLTGFGVYDDIAKHAGAGTLVPITGFANSVVSPALEFKSEGMILGVGAKMFVIAGPVIVYGVLAPVAYGLIAFGLGLY